MSLTSYQTAPPRSYALWEYSTNVCQPVQVSIAKKFFWARWGLRLGMAPGPGS